MGSKINFEKLLSLFESAKGFELTDKEYLEKVGRPLPKENTYIVNNSALAKKAREYGYTLQVKEEPIIQRTIIFNKLQRNK